MSTALIVEDSITAMQIITSCLQKAGLSIMTATSSEEAVIKIKNERPDVIVLDVVLPDRSGFELCRDLKNDTATNEIPVVMCSTKNSDMDKFWGMKQGADAYIAKPVDQEELVRTVQQVIGN